MTADTADTSLSSSRLRSLSMQAFRDMDVNHDGVVSIDEVSHVPLFVPCHSQV